MNDRFIILKKHKTMLHEESSAGEETTGTDKQAPTSRVITGIVTDARTKKARLRD
jgi:hypothetical protein